MNIDRVDQLAQLLWDYHHLGHMLKKTQCILCLCSNDIRVAEHAAELYFAGWAPLLIFSGGVGKLTEGMFGCSEAEYFSRIAQGCGVPATDILIEPDSTNTGENIINTQALLVGRGIEIDSFIVVQKPFMERRSFATFKKHWPNKTLVLSTQDVSFADYPNEVMSKEHIINVMVGDLQRIREYPAKGFQISQEIPDEVWQAGQELIAMGFDDHLI